MRRWTWAPPGVRRSRGRAAVGLAVALALWAFGRPLAAVAVAGLTAAVAIAEAVAPQRTQRVIQALAQGVGRGIGRVGLTAVFCFAIVPLRWLRRGDPLNLGFPGEGSGWKPRSPQAPDARRRWS